MPVQINYSDGGNADPATAVALGTIPDPPESQTLPSVTLTLFDAGRGVQWESAYTLPPPFPGVPPQPSGDGGTFTLPRASGLLIDASTLAAALYADLAGPGRFAHRVTGSAYDDRITGGAGSDRLVGGAGADTLAGGAGGRDRLTGGAGDDVYVITSSNDVVVEARGEGFDVVEAYASYTLPASAEIERVQIRADTDTTIVGNQFDNLIFDGVGNDRLEGGDGNDTLIAQAGDNVLVGGIGDDDYTIFSSGDMIVEQAGEGVDTLRTYASYALSDDQEVERLIAYRIDQSFFLAGNALANTISGSVRGDTLIGRSGDDRLFGDLGDDQLIGGEGADRLDGEGGTDTLSGGTGDDTYVVGFGDTVREIADAGNDTALTALGNYTLADNVEILMSDGFVSSDGVRGATLLGNAGANAITGTTYDDILSDVGAGAFAAGRSGAADTLTGGAGNDLYRIANAATVIVEGRISGGADTVETFFTYRLGTTVENLTLVGSGAINGFGNGGANRLTGNAAANTLLGRGGDDVIVGGGGGDRLVGAAGADTFVFDDGDSAPDARDTILDFAQGVDQIDVSAVDAIYRSDAPKDDAFDFIGTRAFGRDAGELRYEIVGNQTIVSGDTDGDGIADFQFALNGNFALRMEDFAL